MRTLPLALAAVGLLAAPAFAIDWNDERAARAFDELDVNDNGVVSVEEYRTGLRRGERDEGETHYRRIDANGDGRVTPRELRSQWSTANNSLREEVWEHEDGSQERVQGIVFAELDADVDGSVSLREFEAGAKEGESGRAGHEFNRIDDNNDDGLSRGEFDEDWDRFRKVLSGDLLYPQRAETRLSRTERQERAFLALDLNADGELSEGEYSAGVRNGVEAERNFDAIDDNGDGELSRAELYEDWDTASHALRPDLYDAGTVVGVERRVTTERVVERRVVREVSREELDEEFQDIDDNEDGRITARELRRELDDQPRERVEARFHALDRDNDGVIDRPEFDAGWRGEEVEEDGDVEVEIDD